MPETTKPPVDESTGVPGFNTLPRVYLFVAGCFVLWLVLLTLLTLSYT